VIEKAVTYENLDGVKVTKTFYFNLTKAELAEMAILSEDGGGLATQIRAIQESDDPELTLKAFKSVLERAVGRRVGDQLIKTDEVRSEFMNTEAFSEVFMEIFTNPGVAVSFIKGIVPSSLHEELSKNAKARGIELSEKGTVTVDTTLDGDQAVTISEPANLRDITQFTRKELTEMPAREFYELVGNDATKWSKAVLSVAMARRAAE